MDAANRLYPAPPRWRGPCVQKVAIEPSYRRGTYNQYLASLGRYLATTSMLTLERDRTFLCMSHQCKLSFARGYMGFRLELVEVFTV